MRFSTILSLFFLLFLFVPAPSPGKEVLTIAIADNYPPFSLPDVEGEPAGMWVDIWNLWAETTGQEIEFVQTKWKDTLSAVREGKVDIHFGLFHTDKRAETMDFSDSFFEISSALYYIPDQKKPQGFDSLSFQNVGVVEYSFQESFLRKNYPDITVFPYENVEDMIRGVHNGEIRAFLGEEPSVEALMTQLGMRSGIVKSGDEVFRKYVYAGVRRGNFELVEAINSGFEKIPMDQLKKIEANWILDPSQRYYENKVEANELTKEEQAWLDAHPNIRFGIETNYPPFDYVGKNGEHLGITSDYINLISNYLGISVELVPFVQWSTLLDASMSKSIDVLPTAAATKEREVFLNFTEPYVSFPIIIITRQNYSLVTNLSDLSGKTFVMVPDYFQNREVMRRVPSAKVIEASTVLEALKMVSSGQADTYVGNLAVTGYLMRKHNIVNLAVAAPTDIINPGFSFGVRKDWPELHGILTKAFAAIGEEERFFISKKWVSAGVEPTVDYTLVWQIVGGMGTVLLLSFLWGFQTLRQKKVLKASATALRKSEQRIKTILQTTNEGFWLIDGHSNTIDVNQAMCEILGRPIETIIGKSVYEFYNAENQLIVLNQLKNRANGAHGVYEISITRADDVLVPCLFNGTPLYDEQGKNIGSFALVTDITEQKMVELELEKKTQAAEEATRAKSDFLANMSHEVRTPMNSIMGMTHLCLQTELSYKQKDYLNKVFASATSLLGIVNDILDFSKIEAGKLDMESVEFHLDAVMENVSALISFKSQEKDLEFLIQTSTDTPSYLVGDPLRLGQILINLANNAVKFTKKGEVLISVQMVSESEETTTLKFSVKDTGIGLNAEQIENLFQPFSQADTSTTRKFGGTGLGLSICKRLVEMMNGRIWVESEPGVGSKFCFTADFAHSSKNDAAHLRPSADLKGMRVLAVDDNHTSREIFQEMLQSFSFETTIRESGYSALDELKKADPPFDLVLLDWKMPEMDGLETSKRIQDLKLENPPKVILATAIGREEAIRQSEELGLNGFLLKPVTPSTLFDSIMLAFDHEPEGPMLQNIVPNSNENVLKSISGARILVVEDNDVNQQVARELLESVGLVVDIASDGLEGIERVRQASYDLVLMDIQMPVMGGYEATIEIRKDTNFDALPILAMTANTMVGDRERAIEVGMNDHVAKPIDPKQLFATLLQWIKPGVREITKVVSKKEDSEQDNLPDQLPGLDIEGGVNRIGGNQGQFRNLLKRFSKNYGESILTIRNAMEGGNREETEHLVHRFKGVAGNIGANELYQALCLLEAEILKNLESFPESFLDAAQNRLDQVMSSIAALNTMPERSEAKESSASSDQNHAPEISSLLDKLEELLEDQDIDANDVLEQIKECLDVSEEIEKVEKIEEMVINYHFEEASSELQQLAPLLRK